VLDFALQWINGYENTTGDVQEKLIQVSNAKRGKKLIQFSYKSSGLGRIIKICISPYLIGHDYGNFYVYGYNEYVNDVRLYRIEQMRSIEILDDTLSQKYISDDGRLEEVRRRFKHEYNETDTLEEVELMVHHSIYPRVKRDLWNSKTRANTKDDEWVGMMAKTSDLEYFKKFVLREIPNIKVISPDQLVGLVVDDLELGLKVNKVK